MNANDIIYGRVYVYEYRTLFGVKKTSRADVVRIYRTPITRQNKVIAHDALRNKTVTLRPSQIVRLFIAPPL